jgi:hypothetical protein
MAQVQGKDDGLCRYVISAPDRQQAVRALLQFLGRDAVVLLLEPYPLAGDQLSPGEITRL